MSKKMTTSEPTTGEIVRELRKMQNAAQVVLDSGFGTREGENNMLYIKRKAMAKNAADRLEQQEQRIARLENALDTATGTAERYLRELAAAKAEFEVIRQDGICEVCKFGDNAPPDCREYCCFVWRGAREGEGK